MDKSKLSFVTEDKTASRGKRVDLQHSGDGVAYVLKRDHPAGSVLQVRAKGQTCNGPAKMAVKVGSNPWASIEVANSSSWKEFTVPGITSMRKGDRVLIGFSNDFYSPPVCDRNLLVDKFSIRH